MLIDIIYPHNLSREEPVGSERLSNWLDWVPFNFYFFGNLIVKVNGEWGIWNSNYGGLVRKLIMSILNNSVFFFIIQYSYKGKRDLSLGYYENTRKCQLVGTKKLFSIP